MWLGAIVFLISLSSPWLGLFCSSPERAQYLLIPYVSLIVRNLIFFRFIKNPSAPVPSAVEDVRRRVIASAAWQSLFKSQMSNLRFSFPVSPGILNLPEENLMPGLLKIYRQSRFHELSTIGRVAQIQQSIIY
jgi:hypothetical protein